MKFTLKKSLPQDVEAFQYGRHGLPDWARAALHKGQLEYHKKGCVLIIAAKQHIVHIGDYVMLDPTGCLKSMAPGVFEVLYEKHTT